MKWEEKKLTNFVWFQRGFDLPCDKFIDGDIPVIGSTSILGYHNEAKVKAPGIVTGRSGTIGHFQFIKQDFWPHNTSLWVKDFKGNDELFAFYLLQTLDFNALNGGGAVPTLNRNFLSSITIKVPPLPIQRKIASILSAYDDLIENNLKRIKLLEDSSYNLYKSLILKSELSEDSLNNIANITMGQSPKSTTYNNEGIGLPFHQGVSHFSNYFVDNVVYCKEPLKIAYPNDILVSVRAPVGRINFTKDKICIGRGLCSIRSKLGFQNFLYFSLKDFFFDEDIIGNGAIFNAATKSDLLDIKLKIPNNDIQSEFEHRAENNYRAILNLTTQNKLLRKSRDILLPKLMNEEIEINNFL